jgi:hypothetical protein
MTSHFDSVQDWAGVWIQQQQRCLQQWVQSQQGDDSPEQVATTAMQAWQQGCELWQSSISKTLPANLVLPFATLAKQSHDDLQRALYAAQLSNQHPDASETEAGTSANLDSSFNPLDAITNIDLARLNQDPTWIEHLQAFNAFIQFHIQLTIAGLNKLKAQLTNCQDQNMEEVVQRLLGQLLSDYQSQLESEEYQQIFNRLVNSLVVQASPPA